jgi:hypothetical protein
MRKTEKDRRMDAWLRTGAKVAKLEKQVAALWEQFHAEFSEWCEAHDRSTRRRVARGR